VVGLRERFCGLVRGGKRRVDIGAVMRLRRQQRRMRRRRQASRTALVEQRVRESIVVGCGQRRVYRMRWKIGLHDDLARQSRAACATGDLRQQREHPFGRAKIGAIERIVGADHAHAGEARKIVTLREHLGADHHVDLAALDARADIGERAPRARGVAVDARDPRAGKRVGERARQALRTEALWQEIDVAARRTRRRYALLMPAMMAAQCGRLAMQRKARAAARARCLP
jgi:hypothetical protein